VAKHVFSALCSKSIIDRETNQLSLINVPEGIEISPISESEYKDNTIPISGGGQYVMELVCLWRRSDFSVSEKGHARLVVKSPSGEKVSEVDIPINLETSAQSRNIIKFPAFSFKGPGTYIYVLQQQKGTEKKPRWITVAEIPFGITFSQKQPSD